jgi:LmbE family N-acetylglucosaminyl deacetylase
MLEQTFAPLNPKVILGVVAHPDDLEFSVAGAVAKYVSKGAKAYYYILTNANKGSADRNMTSEELGKIRQNEQREAAKILGVSDVFFGNYEDGMLEVTSQLKCDIVRIIRQVKPDVVVTLDPTMVYSASLGIINHTDHRAAGEAALDAVYPLARDHLSFPELCTAEKLEPHKVSTVLMSNFEKQNYYEDITDYMETKIQALCMHASQFTDPKAVAQMVRKRAEQAGVHVGSKYAESFIRLDLSF